MISHSLTECRYYFVHPALFLIIISFPLPVIFLGQETSSEDDIKKIELYLNLLSEKDPLIRKDALNNLKSFDKKVLPVIEKLLMEKELEHIYSFITETMLLEFSDPDSTIKKDDNFLATLIQNSGKVKNTVKNAVISDLLSDIAKEINNKNINKALDVIKLIQGLFPDNPYKTSIERLKTIALLKEVECYVQINSRVNSIISAGDEVITFEIKFKSAASNKTAISFLNNVSAIQVKISARELDALMSEQSLSKTCSVAIPQNFTIDKDKDQTIKIEINTKDYFADSKCLRLFYIQPVIPAFEYAIDQTKKISSVSVLPTIFKVIPKEYEYLKDNPAKYLLQIIDQGKVNDVFICALLLKNSTDENTAIEYMIKSLEKMDNKNGEAITIRILELLTDTTGQAGKSEWIKWWKNRTSK